jgi:hypothetical protein
MATLAMPIVANILKIASLIGAPLAAVIGGRMIPRKAQRGSATPPGPAKGLSQRLAGKLSTCWITLYY